MDPFHYTQADLQQPETKNIISKSFFAVFVLAAVALISQAVIDLFVDRFIPEIVNADWYIWVVTLMSLVLIAFPIYYLLMRPIPDSPRKEINKIKPSALIIYFFICAAAMYITNILTIYIVTAISFITGIKLINPLAEVRLSGSNIIGLIYSVIIAPVIEETIFRNLLLNKLRRFGDVPAILMTGLAFGLFHFNLYQFFYATVLGFLFAYITLRTNTIKYSVILHIAVNFIGSLVSLIALDENIFAAYLLILWMFSSITIGTIFFVLNIKKIKLEGSQQKVKARTFILNPGVILFAVLSLSVFVLNTMANIIMEIAS